MRKVTTVVLAVVLTGGIVVGCGLAPSEKSVTNKLATHAQQLDQQSYKSTAMMTVQMDNTSQSYYVETWYQSPDVYRIALGDQNKQIHQIIIHNDNGMFVVSPSLGKVFRFNGNWAQNQGHIYLYDQLLQQIIDGKEVSMTKKNGIYQFELPVTSTNDIVKTQRIQIDAKTLNPKQVQLLDAKKTEIVTLTFQSFTTGTKFQKSDFDPQSILAADKSAKETMASADESFGYITPDALYGDKLQETLQPSNTDIIMRFTGGKAFTLQEMRPQSGVAGMANASLVDLFGVPAVLSGTSNVHDLTWLNNGVEFSMTSAALSPDEMENIAISTMGQVGK